MLRLFNQYVSAKSLLLMITEGWLIVLSLICAVKLRFWNDPTESALYMTLPDFGIQIAIVVTVCLVCLHFNHVYDLQAARETMQRILQTEQAIGAASIVLGTLYVFVPELLLNRGVLLIGMALVMAVLISSRKPLDKVWQLTIPEQRIAIVGSGKLAGEVARELARRDDLGVRFAGFVRTGPDAGGGSAGDWPVLGAAAELEAIAQKHGISRIVVALEDCRGALPARELVTLRVQGIRVEDAATALSALTGRVPLAAVKPSWFVFSDGFRRSRTTEVMKRILDLAVGLVGLAAALPLMGLVALAIRLESKGPVIYRQKRVGRFGKEFDVLKFRSMRADAEKNTGALWAQENDPRVTRVGRVIRKYRLDEMPQFVNVIQGEMSFVGPRPERRCFVEELRKVIPYYDERHSVRPGITGWAQVQYRYGGSVEDAFQKLEYDLFYLKNTSLTFDLAIIFRTFRIVLGGYGSR